MTPALCLAAALFARAAAAVPAPVPALPFIEDDAPRALAEARARRKPLFVDAWAPWCHSCLSFRSFVLTDPALRPLADAFVWLAIDTEKPGNAAFVARHPIEAWPTLLVLDVPATGDEKVVKSWQGALKTADFVAWLGEARRARPGGDSRDRQREAAVAALRRAKKDDACVAEADRAVRALPPGPSRLATALEGLTCAGRLAGAPAAARTLEAALDAMVAAPGLPVLADDRSSAYEVLVERAEARKDHALALRRAAAWAAFLEREAARAPTPEGRAVFDAHRTAAYLALGEPARAVPMLERSARDFPGDYNPPARLARALLAAGRVADAQAAIERALGLVYGPRRQRLEALRDEIAAAARP